MTTEFPIPRLSPLDAALQLCKDFAVPTIASALLAMSLPSFPPSIETDAAIPFGFVGAFLLWCSVCDAWFLLMRYWRNLIDMIASCVSGFFDALGAALDGSAGAAIAGIMKCASPLLILALIIMAVTLACSWVESTAPESLCNVLTATVLVGVTVAVTLVPLRTLAKDLRALATALR
ncbi:hypothetical protein B5F40_13590 [Gordonibacter sp. An230]|uniref:hypothetical protein n=1 Tax=Gordonibacter sp. An230 TaxID=1965592 RepID=UPI000B3AD0E6|nr:hypothetical protein [Gordonibacter sp. An230]OUO87564.1 hypothetical protein B5F40_13590 [Gordonibacter sp. An230]